jgi:Uma2 family endonuclease
MHVSLSSLPRGTIIYPDSDGKPMSDNTKQGRWMVMLFGNLCALFRKAADVFIAADNLWYPVEGEPEIRIAPDVYLVFGRPKGDRGSYKQWEEDDIPVTVAFEILSPNNTLWEMADKLAFYDTYGVEEYYVYDPDTNRLLIYSRQGTALRRVHGVEDFVSPRLGIRFVLTEPEMTVYGPDGRPFLTFEQLEEQRLEAQRQADAARQAVTAALQQADTARRQAARLAELGRKARLGQATAEELQELERLEAQAAPPPS